MPDVSGHQTAWRDLPGLRVLVAIGPMRLVRLLVALVLLWSWIQVVAVMRPDLARPAEIGTDSSNYYAAGIRLADGHRLYRLTVGDRPVPADDPPYFSAPLLSPPGVAALWRLLAVLPGALVMTGWWLSGVVLTTAGAISIVGRAPGPALLATVPLSLGLATVAWSGNLNAYLLPLLMLVWPMVYGIGATRRTMAVAGVIVAAAAALKLTPIFLLLWLISGRRRPAVIAGIIALGVLGLAILAVAGLDGIVDYVSVSRSTASAGATSLSPGAMLAAFGVAPTMVALAPLLVGIVVVIALVLMRGRPTVGFVIATVGLVFASPVVRMESLALLLVGVAPWLHLDRLQVFGLRPKWVRAAAVVAVATALVGTGVLASRAGESGLSVINDSGSEVVVRFVHAQSGGSFGYLVPARTKGVAWLEELGTFLGQGVVLDGQCRVLSRFDVTGISSVVTVGPDDAATNTGGPPPPATLMLPYSSRCAAEVDTTPAY